MEATSVWGITAKGATVFDRVEPERSLSHAYKRPP